MPIRLTPKILALALGGLVTTVVIVLVLLYILAAWWSTPIFGFGADGPDQPIAFPHTVHVQDAGIACEFCHRNVTKGEAATVPAVEQCLFCHETITGENNPDIAKLLAHAGLDPTGENDPSIVPQPIGWERVHRLPDHVQFAHEPHIRFFTTLKGMTVEQVCSICHGEIRGMENVKQQARIRMGAGGLKMGDCVDCHRDNDAPTDCVTCHY